MPADNLLTLDVGTSSLKAALYDATGNLLAKASADYPLHYPKPGWAEQNPQDWWKACCTACRVILSRKVGPVRGICVSGQAPGCVPIDRQGSPLRPAILWLDRRAAPQVDWLVQHLGLEETLRTSANTLDSYFGGVKWLWYRQNEPENYTATWKILQANGYVLYQLTGKAVTDPSHAGICSPCFDFGNQIWSEVTCEQMGIDMEKLPMIAPSIAQVGTVTPEAAQATGLPAGVPVFCGGADFACSCLGSGVLGSGSVSLMLGTAGNLMFPAAPRTDPRLLNTIHVTGDILSCGGVLAGAAVNWFGEMLKIDMPDLYGTLDREAADIPPGAEGLVFLPYLMGERSPIWDPHARGAYIGLLATHGRAHLYRAVLEGVGFAFRQMLEILKENGALVNEIVAINGGARSLLWRQILADVLQVPIRWRPTKDGTTLGGAYLAALGAGLFNRFEDITAWLEPTIDTFPNLANVDIYQRRYAVYAGLYDKLKSDFLALRQ